MSEEKLEEVISWILMGGVVLSGILEAWGIFLYRQTTGSLALAYTPAWKLSGNSFFAYLLRLARDLGSGKDHVSMMALGIAVLMMTPYLRVVAAAIYYALRRDGRYLAITLFVLGVLTWSLAAH